jgi:hypothetical protein
MPSVSACRTQCLLLQVHFSLREPLTHSLIFTNDCSFYSVRYAIGQRLPPQRFLPQVRFSLREPRARDVKKQQKAAAQRIDDDAEIERRRRLSPPQRQEEDLLRGNRNGKTRQQQYTEIVNAQRDAAEAQPRRRSR